MTFLSYCTALLAGLPTTLILSFSAICLAGILAVIFAIYLKEHKHGFGKKSLNGFLIFFTGTPLLVQMFIFYSFFPFIQFNLVALPIPIYDVLSSPWFVAILALTLNSAAYTTQLFYGALKTIPVEMEQACETLGMNRSQTLRIIVPYALKRALSTYGNEIIFVVKGSALASTITLMDLTGYYNQLMGEYYDFTVLFAVAFIYLMINLILSLLMRFVEYKGLKFER